MMYVPNPMVRQKEHAEEVAKSGYHANCDLYRYSEILDYHNVDGQNAEGPVTENGFQQQKA